MAGVARTGAVTSAIATLVSTSATRLEVVEVGVFVASAVAGDVLLGRPAAVGITASGGVAGQATDSADVAASGTVVPSWTTSPTSPTIPMARVTLPATIGAGMVWTFNRGELIVPVSANFVLFAVAAVNYTAYMKWYE